MREIYEAYDTGKDKIPSIQALKKHRTEKKRSIASAELILENIKRKNTLQQSIGAEDYSFTGDNDMVVGNSSSSELCDAKIDCNSYSESLMDDILQTVLEAEELIDDNDVCFALTRELDYQWKDIWNNVKDTMRELHHCNDTINEGNDTNEMLYDGCDFSTADLAADLLTFLHDNTKFKRAQDDIMLLLNKYFPKEKGFNLPVRITRKGTTNSMLNKYTAAMIGTLHFDICPSKCSVYAGNELLNESCIKCNEPRLCRITDYQICYRPFGVIIQRLLHTKGFLSAINYTRVCNLDEDIYRDIQDGVNYKKHIIKWKVIIGMLREKEKILSKLIYFFHNFMMVCRLQNLKKNRFYLYC
jgi:hypothetical protein